MLEEWRAVDGYPGYEVSNLGRVRSLDRIVTSAKGFRIHFMGKILKQNKSGSGYFQAVLCKAGKPKNLSVHRIVASAFIGSIPCGMHVCHNDGDKHNNAASNLRIDTRAGNIADCKRHSTSPEGERNAMSTLTEDDVFRIRDAAASGNFSRSKLAKQFGVSQPHISMIVRGKAWPHIGGPRLHKVPNKGEGASNAKLTEADVISIRQKYANGMATMAELAREFGVCRPSVSHIVRRRNWGHVP